MALHFDFKKKTNLQTRLGLDIGAGTIKMVELAISGKENPILTSFGTKDVDAAQKAAVSERIKELAAGIRVTAKEATIAVSGPAVIVRFIAMPRMSREELSGAIRFEAEKHIPFNINDCVIDFQVLRQYEKENKSDVLLAAVKREYVTDRVKLVQDAGFSVRAVDIDGFALANAFLRNYPQEGGEKTVLLLDIGAALTNLTILKGQSLCLVRDVAIGGKDFRAVAAKACNVDPKNSDELARMAAEKAQEIALQLKPVLSNLLDEIRLSCSYYENQCGRMVEEIYVSGGASSVPSLTELFTEAFGFKPNFLNPFMTIDTVNVDAAALEKARGALAVAVGLALR